MKCGPNRRYDVFNSLSQISWVTHEMLPVVTACSMRHWEVLTSLIKMRSSRSGSSPLLLGAVSGVRMAIASARSPIVGLSPRNRRPSAGYLLAFCNPSAMLADMEQKGAGPGRLRRRDLADRRVSSLADVGA